jgi:hypothetical protein
MSFSDTLKSMEMLFKLKSAKAGNGPGEVNLSQPSGEVETWIFEHRETKCTIRTRHKDAHHARIEACIILKVGHDALDCLGAESDTKTWGFYRESDVNRIHVWKTSTRFDRAELEACKELNCKKEDLVCTGFREGM